jgi:hypothetical protein
MVYLSTPDIAKSNEWQLVPAIHDEGDGPVHCE